MSYNDDIRELGPLCPCVPMLATASTQASQHTRTSWISRLQHTRTSYIHTSSTPGLPMYHPSSTPGLPVFTPPVHQDFLYSHLQCSGTSYVLHLEYSNTPCIAHLQYSDTCYIPHLQDTSCKEQCSIPGNAPPCVTGCLVPTAQMSKVAALGFCPVLAPAMPQWPMKHQTLSSEPGDTSSISHH